jgi:NAD+ diphosphatase
VNSGFDILDTNGSVPFVVFCGAEVVLCDASAGQVFWDRSSIGLMRDVIDVVIPIMEGINSALQCYAVLLTTLPAQADLQTITTRQLLSQYGFDAFIGVGRASQWMNWFRSHRYCGFCGGPTQIKQHGRLVHCADCEHDFYPRINPCIIVLVSDGDRLLLARSQRRGAVFFSCLAGFIEPGETVEEAVAREVFEEAGIQVKDIEYVKSQPWPFPSQLMLGFYASYAGGELNPCPEEIAEADWYTVDALPATPAPSISVAGQLIEEYCRRYRR